jgi:hypothetical protein
MTVATALTPAGHPNRVVWLLRRDQLLSYFLIAYAFTAAFDFLIVANFPDAPSFPRDFGPSVAALVVTAAVAGKVGVKRLLARLVLWRIPVRWYLIVLLGIPAIYALGIVLVVPGRLPRSHRQRRPSGCSFQGFLDSFTSRSLPARSSRSPAGAASLSRGCRHAGGRWRAPSSLASSGRPGI